jgi:hypothetical protein
VEEALEYQPHVNNGRRIRMQEQKPPAFANTEIARTQAQQHPHPYSRVLFHHEPHLHEPRNANRLQEAEQAASGFNTRVAVALTKGVGTMWTAYSFAVLAVIGLFAILGLLTPIIALLVAWASQTFLQLVFLPIILVGQNVLGRKSELQVDEQYRTTMSAYHDIEQILNHLSAQDAELLLLSKHLLAQDAELLRHAKLFMYLLEKNGISPEQLAAEGATPTHLDAFIHSLSAQDASASPAPAESEKQNT